MGPLRFKVYAVNVGSSDVDQSFLTFLYSESLSLKLTLLTLKC